MTMECRKNHCEHYTKLTCRKLTDIEQRAFIKICANLNQWATRIHGNFFEIYGEVAYPYKNVAKWVGLFKARKAD